jgi:ribosomal protein L37E
MSYNHEFRVILEAMGLDPHKHLPATGTEPVVVWWRGYKINAWVTPKLARMSMRVHAYCPVCGREMAVARLTHHVDTARCYRHAFAVARGYSSITKGAYEHLATAEERETQARESSHRRTAARLAAWRSTIAEGR